MSVAMLLFMLENCLVDVNVDYSAVWSCMPEQASRTQTSVFEQLRLFRRSFSKKRYCSLVEKVSEEVAKIEKSSVMRS
ncbi:MAG: hypothetical protein QXI19_08855, partial [Candidatus Caldarchaeum sp.]